MGTDIHWYSETRRDGKWECDQADSYKTGKYSLREMDYFYDNDRNYLLFGLLAGVRRDVPWGWAEKGFPDDASDEVRVIYAEWGSDAHTPSYLTRAELREKLAELVPECAKALIGPDHPDQLEQLKHLTYWLNTLIDTLVSDVPDTDQRIVFWFDN